jgi:single-stranded-DNA-specific exonuclease
MKAYKWNINTNVNEDVYIPFSLQLNIHPVLAQLLLQRGIQTPQQRDVFFNPSVYRTHSPFLMKDMGKAIKRILSALDSQENILVYGDYDVDGTTAVACMFSFLSKFSTSIEFYIPDRYTEGYGISSQGIDYAIEKKTHLIIALDCGIKAHSTIEKAQKSGIDVIVCDHHEPGETLPPASAILNPKRHDCSYPFKELSGCGVGFKLIHGIVATKHLNHKEYLYTYLDILAISIASDIVPIVDENRIFMHFGLLKIQRKPHIGVRAMLQSAQIADTRLSVSDVVFKIGPRINAAGRIFSGRKAVELLLSNTYDDAMKLCTHIDSYNNERKSIDARITQEALEMIENDSVSESNNTTVLYKEDWHKGVVGIVASRIIEQHYKPTIILCGEDEMITGSARSVQNFDLYSALEKCEKSLHKFGGHMYAAGMSLEKEKLPEFKKQFEQAVSETITQEQKIPSINIDVEIHSSDIHFSFYDDLVRLGPFGPGNMTPVFILRGVHDSGHTRCVGKDKAHLQLCVSHSDSPNIVLRGIGFNLAQKWKKLSEQTDTFDICFTLQENNFRNQRRLQLDVRDIRKSEVIVSNG